MAKKRREVILRFKCAECDKEVVLTRDEDIIGICETQITAETRQLHCLECQ